MVEAIRLEVGEPQCSTFHPRDPNSKPAPRKNRSPPCLRCASLDRWTNPCLFSEAKALSLKIKWFGQHQTTRFVIQSARHQRMMATWCNSSKALGKGEGYPAGTATSSSKAPSNSQPRGCGPALHQRQEDEAVSVHEAGRQRLVPAIDGADMFFHPKTLKKTWHQQLPTVHCSFPNLPGSPAKTSNQQQQLAPRPNTTSRAHSVTSTSKRQTALEASGAKRKSWISGPTWSPFLFKEQRNAVWTYHVYISYIYIYIYIYIYLLQNKSGFNKVMSNPNKSQLDLLRVKKNFSQNRPFLCWAATLGKHFVDRNDRPEGRNRWKRPAPKPGNRGETKQMWPPICWK